MRLLDGIYGRALWIARKAADRRSRVRSARGPSLRLPRGQRSGIVHDPLESIINNDAELCVCAFRTLLEVAATRDP